LILGLACGLVACSSGSGSNDDEAVSLNDLDGSWTTPCFVDAMAMTSEMDVFTFDQGDISAVVTTYAGTTCSGMMMQEIQTATYVLGATVSVDGSVAGITVATEIDITNTTPGPDFGDIDYDIIAIRNNNLYAGDTDGANDGTTPALRPTQLDPDVVLTRL